MSIVNVFIGQCGNQVGTDFLRSLAISSGLQNHHHHQQQQNSLEEFDPVFSTFFRREKSSSLPRARVVCIDMEPKVIQNCDTLCQRSGLFSLPPVTSKARVTRSSGSGNNWACGYCTHGRNASEDIVQALRFEAEKADVFGGFHLVHSVAGGTGSGIGSLTSDLIRENFGGKNSIPLSHTVVWPYEHGELSPQWINCALTLAVLDETADAVHVISNDTATLNLKSAPMFVNRSRVNVSIPFSCVNAWMAREMTAIWMPTTRKVPLFDLVSNITNVSLESSSSSGSESDNENDARKKPRNNNKNNNKKNQYLSPLTFSDKIASLCPTRERKFFESCSGTVSVLDDPVTSSELVSMIHGNSTLASQNLSPTRPGTANNNRSTRAFFTRSEIISMLHGSSANSYPEALARSFRSITAAQEEGNTTNLEQESEEHHHHHQQQQQQSTKRLSDLIICHGSTSQQIWTTNNNNLSRMLQMIAAQSTASTTIGISAALDQDDEDLISQLEQEFDNDGDEISSSTTRSKGICFPPLCDLRYADEENNSLDDTFTLQKEVDFMFQKATTSTLSIYSNSISFGRRVDRGMKTAETLLSTGAFLHHFTQRGLEEEDLKEAVIQCYDIASRYGVKI